MINNFYTLRITDRVHEYIKLVLNKGDLVIDCTMGNGFDTKFLYDCVGNEGIVIAFDIQKEAIIATNLLIGNKENVFLVHGSHEFFDEKLSIVTENSRKPKAILFNLGYLPGGIKNITTNSKSTIKAIQKSLELLDKEGLLSIVTYPGHPEGFDEDIQISCLLEQLSAFQFEVILTTQFNKSNKAPKHYLVYKKNYNN